MARRCIRLASKPKKKKGPHATGGPSSCVNAKGVA
jgi:hypothetical protein